MDKLQECYKMTLSIIELINNVPENIIEEERDESFSAISEQLTQRGEIVKELQIIGVDTTSKLYQEFMKSDALLFSLFKKERERLLGVSRKIDRNRKVITSYLK